MQTPEPSRQLSDRLRGIFASLLPAILLIAATLFVLIRLDRPLVRGDGVPYLAWTDSLVLDRDVELANQEEKFRHVSNYAVIYLPATNRYSNAFAFGVGILQAPFYLLGDQCMQQDRLRANPAYFIAMQGVERPYSLGLMLGANVYALLTVLIGWRLARRLADSWTAALLAFAFLIGTPLLYYSTTFPLNSHNPGAFMMSVFVALLVAIDRPFQDEPTESPRHIGWWVGLGVCGGLMVLVRWQLGLVAGLAGLLLIRRRAHWWPYAPAAALAGLLSLLPLLLVWNDHFGAPLVVPYEELHHVSFRRSPLEMWDEVTARLLAHSPLVILSVFGLLYLYRLNRAWAFFAAAALLSQVMASAGVTYALGSEAYGARRLTELYPFYVLLAAALAGRLVRPGAGRSASWFRGLSVRLLVVLLMGYMLLYIRAFYVYTWTEGNEFAASPREMLVHYYAHPDAEGFWEILEDTHLGPDAWDKPGP